MADFHILDFSGERSDVQALIAQMTWKTSPPHPELPFDWSSFIYPAGLTTRQQGVAAAAIERTYLKTISPAEEAAYRENKAKSLAVIVDLIERERKTAQRKRLQSIAYTSAAFLGAGAALPTIASILTGGAAATTTASGLPYIADAALPATLQPATVVAATTFPLTSVGILETLGGVAGGAASLAGGVLSTVGKVAGGALEVLGGVAGGTLDVLGKAAGGTLEVIGGVAGGLPGVPGLPGQVDQEDQPMPGQPSQAGQPILVMPGQPTIISQPESGEKVPMKLVLYLAAGVGVMLIAIRMLKK